LRARDIGRGASGGDDFLGWKLRIQNPQIPTDKFSMFEWKPEYAMGIKSLDAEHQKLFAIGRELYAAMTAGKASAALGMILDRLVKYTLEHFAHEETLMRSYKYPGFARHKAEHDALVKKVGSFQVEFQAGRAALAAPLLQFIKDWLEHHIKESDAAYAPTLKAQNVA
jgi:hemerythrin-like metal-binding protein